MIYNTILLSGKVFTHLAEVDLQASELHDKLMRQIAAQAGITEQLKAQDKMAWVQHINAIHAQVWEIIDIQIIFST